MLVPFDQRQESLRETVRVLTTTADNERRAQAARDNFPLGWERAVNWLFDRIESVYLLEFLILRLIETRRGEKQLWAHGPQIMSVGTLTLLIGAETVHIEPVYQHPNRVTLILFNPKYDREFEFFCDFADHNPQWMAVMKEIGMRRLVESYLPGKTRVLSEQLFNDVLSESLRGPQRALLFGRTEMRNALSRALDFATSAEWRVAINRLSDKIRRRFGARQEEGSRLLEAVRRSFERRTGSDAPVSRRNL